MRRVIITNNNINTNTDIISIITTITIIINTNTDIISIITTNIINTNIISIITTAIRTTTIIIIINTNTDIISIITIATKIIMLSTFTTRNIICICFIVYYYYFENYITTTTTIMIYYYYYCYCSSYYYLGVHKPGGLRTKRPKIHYHRPGCWKSKKASSSAPRNTTKQILKSFQKMYDVQILTVLCINYCSVNVKREWKASVNKNALVCIY